MHCGGLPFLAMVVRLDTLLKQPGMWKICIAYGEVVGNHISKKVSVYDVVGS